MKVDESLSAGKGNVNERSGLPTMCASLPNLVIPANAGNLKRDINPASLDSRLVEGDEKNELAHIVGLPSAWIFQSAPPLSIPEI